MEGSSLTHGCVTMSTCNLRLSVKNVPKTRSQNFGTFPNFRNVPKLVQTQKHFHAPELTCFSSSSFPPECRRDEVSRNHHQQPPTSAAASAATRPAREGPWVPGSAPSPPHDEVPEHGHGMWRGARGRCPSAMGRPPCPFPSRGWSSPTRHPPAHLTVTLLVWRLT